MRKAIQAAFPVTIPVMLGYLSVGLAFGLVLEKSGFSVGYALLMSLIIYAGAMQFIAINLLLSGLGLFEIGLMTLFVNIRHMFYGLSFLDTFKQMGRLRPYMIFSLTDETYSLLCGAKVPEGVDQDRFYFAIALLNQCYWVAGSVLGAVAGQLITFNTAGIDFAMTALFVVIFIEQWYSYQTHLPALLGLGATVVSLVIFGPSQLVLPSMILMTLGLLLLRNRIQFGEAAGIATEKAGENHD